MKKILFFSLLAVILVGCPTKEQPPTTVIIPTATPTMAPVTIFTDSFENALDAAWTYDLGGPVSYNTTNVNTGTYSLNLDDAGSWQIRYETVTRIKGKVSVWFYDDATDLTINADVRVGRTDVSPCGCIRIGVASDITGDVNYYWFSAIGGTFQRSSLARSTGWHLLEFVADGVELKGYIDGNLIVATTSTSGLFDQINLNHETAALAITGGAFDDLEIVRTF